MPRDYRKQVQQGKRSLEDRGGKRTDVVARINTEMLDAVLTKYPFPEGLSNEQKMALAKRFVDMTRDAVKNNPALQSANPLQVWRGLLDAAAMGLELGPQRHMYLVPFDHGAKVELIIDARGYIHMARRVNVLANIAAGVIFENDNVSHAQGTDGHFRITWDPFADRGDPVGAYAYARLKDGEEYYVILNLEQIRRHRDASPSWRKTKSGPWKDWWEAMARKTAIKELFYLLPIISNSFSLALAADQRVEDHDDVAQRSGAERERTIIDVPSDPDEDQPEPPTEESTAPPVDDAPAEPTGVQEPDSDPDEDRLEQDADARKKVIEIAKQKGYTPDKLDEVCNNRYHVPFSEMDPDMFDDLARVLPKMPDVQAGEKKQPEPEQEDDQQEPNPAPKSGSSYTPRNRLLMNVNRALVNADWDRNQTKAAIEKLGVRGEGPADLTMEYLRKLGGAANEAAEAAGKEPIDLDA